MLSIFGSLIGLINICITVACLIWAAADSDLRSTLIVVGVLSFNAAMAWFLVAGIRRKGDGQLTWSAAPLVVAAIGTVAVVAVGISKAPLAPPPHAGQAPFKLWRCPDGSETLGSESPCDGGRVVR